MSVRSTDAKKSRGLGVTRLSAAELSQLGQLAIATRYGRDARSLRLKFDELKASRELGEAAERLVAARIAQGLPPRIEDVGALSRIASLIAGVGTKASAPRARKRKAATRSRTARRGTDERS
jgi:hypothetical protein